MSPPERLLGQRLNGEPLCDLEGGMRRPITLGKPMLKPGEPSLSV